MSVDPKDLGGPYASVFDVGAYKGEFAQACLEAWPDCRVESFEPLLPAPWEIKGNWRWWQTALGVRQGVVPMYRNASIPSSSILKMTELHKSAYPFTRREDTTTVHIDMLVEYEDFIVEPALLKIDVQGYELFVLQGARDALKRFQTVVLEVSHEELYEGAPTPEELDDFLVAMGFRHDKRVDEMVHPKDGRLLQSDEIYIRH